MTSDHHDQVMTQAEAWLALDQDQETADQLKKLIKDSAVEELAELFARRLEFGTAGIRAAIGVGPLRMNHVVVRQTAAGIGRWVTDKLGAGIAAKVVVGFDARTHSAAFAATAAQSFAQAGHIVTTWDQAIPTPLVAFATKQLEADIGIIITASHNPATDNGMKVYVGGRLGEGRQLNTPDDSMIASAIEAEIKEQAASFQQKEDLESALGVGSTKVQVQSAKQLQQHYCRMVVERLKPTGGLVPFVYTAIHGVGLDTFVRLLKEAGFVGMTAVKQQCEPDGTFPTAPQPNPEVAGVLDLAQETAVQAGIDVIVAHDPDADRCAVAFRDGESSFRQLSGDELGMALAGWLVDTGRLVDGAVAMSLVSHSALPALAAEQNLKWVQTLTGFKWIAAVPQLRFGYEEALGYCLLPDVVADKDGLSAGLGVVEMLHWIQGQGISLADYLVQLAERYGHTSSSQLTVPILAGTAVLEAAKVFDEIETLAGLQIVERRNLANKMGPLPPTPGLVFSSGQKSFGVRVILRPSGTEPLLKIYLHAWSATARHCAELLRLLEDDVQMLLKQQDS